MDYFSISRTFTPLLLWIGFFLFSELKIKPFLIAFCASIAIFGLNVFPITSPLLYPVMFATFVLFIWSSHSKRQQNFYYLALAALCAILASTWLNVVYYVFAIDFGDIYADLLRFISTLMLLYTMKYFFKRFNLLTTIRIGEEVHQNFLSILMMIALSSSFAAHGLAKVFVSDCETTRFMQLFLAFFLFLPLSGLILISDSLIKKEYSLNSTLTNLETTQDHLKKTNLKLTKAENELEEHYQLIYQLKREGLNKKEELEQLADSLHAHKEHIAHLEDYLGELSNYQEKARRFEHDILYMLRALNEARHMKNWELFDQFSKDIELESTNLIGLNPKLVVLTNLVGDALFPIRHLISAKSVEAKTFGISFTTEIPEIIETINMPIMDLVRILSNWLNNAIEEAQNLHNKWIHISFLNITSAHAKNILQIRISNSCRNNLPLNLSQLNISGKSSKGLDRGYGLPIVEEIVDKHPNVFNNTTVTKDIYSYDDQKKFVQLLEIET